MTPFKKGTPAFGIMLGILLAGAGALWMAIGFWKTLLLAALFAAGYLLGTVENKRELIREAANRIIPRKNAGAIDLRSELVKEQQQRMDQIYGKETGTTDLRSEAAKEAQREDPILGKEAEAIDLRSELMKEQQQRMEQMNRSSREAAKRPEQAEEE